MTTRPAFKECDYPRCSCPRHGRCGNAFGPADPRGPFFSTQWERDDYERRQRGEPELGPVIVSHVGIAPTRDKA